MCDGKSAYRKADNKPRGPEDIYKEYLERIEAFKKRIREKQE
jgi:hypothetical protein